MNLISWLKEKLGSKPVPLTGVNDLLGEYMSDTYIREMAFWSCVNLIANALSKCEFKTFIDGVEVKDREYYLWNFEPNKNQNSTAFLHKLIAQLYRTNECLVIENMGELFIADSFDKKDYILYGDIFREVTVGDYKFNNTFNQSDVLYFRLGECDMRSITNGIYASYVNLIAYGMKSYQKSRGTKGVFNYETLPMQGQERELFDDLINNRIGKWLSSDSGALPLGKGQKWTELQHKTYSSENTRDIRAMIDDVCDFTAKGFNIPSALVRGDVQGITDVQDQFLTFCIDPLTDFISEEINRKRYGYNGISTGSYIKIDTKTIKHVDLLSVSASIDKLISSGAFCVNDIRELVGENIINEDWANQHFITKNYEPFEQAMKSLQGGEKD